MTIQEKYDAFIQENGCEPTYAVASVVFKDLTLDDPVDNLTFKLSCSEDENDDEVFYYTNGMSDIIALTKKDGVEDFYILENTVGFYK